MLFIVPDDSDETQTPAENGGEESAPLKAQLDDGGGTSRATKKVDLDLDDAPFLEEEEEEEAAPEPVQEEIAPEPEKEKRPLPAWLKNKFLWIGLVALLLVSGVAVKFLFFRKAEAPAPPPPLPVEEKKPEQPPPPPVEKPKPKEEGETILRLEPFMVEQRDKEGNIRFVNVRLVFNTKDPRMATNFTQETLTIRNAVYYYLKNKDLQFLADEKNSERLKTELLAVVNQYMGAGQFETLLFEDYVVK